MKDRTNSTSSFAISLYIVQWLVKNPFGYVWRCWCFTRNMMFPATSQVKFLIDELNIISSAVLPTKYAEARRLLYLGGGGWGEGGEGGEERFSVVWWGCAGCWVGNGFCHLTPKQEYTIWHESFLNKVVIILFNPNYEQGIACTNELIFLMEVKCTSDLQHFLNLLNCHLPTNDFEDRKHYVLCLKQSGV